MFRQALNQNGFYYANYVGEADRISDVTGLPTGEKTRTFETPTFAWGNISSTTGRMTVDGFGWNVDYELNIVPSKDLPINEGARLWIHSVPPAAHDYECVRVYRSVNEVTLAAKKLP